MNKDPAKDEEIRTKECDMWQSFSKLPGDDGPFLLGADFSFADVLLIPFCDQFLFLWPHGTELIPTESEAFPQAGTVQAWTRAVEERESLKQFLQGRTCLWCRLTRQSVSLGTVLLVAAFTPSSPCEGTGKRSDR